MLVEELDEGESVQRQLYRERITQNKRLTTSRWSRTNSNRSHPESGCILNRLPGNPWHFSGESLLDSERIMCLMFDFIDCSELSVI